MNNKNIQYKIGDATNITHGCIFHVCNDIGAWGSGFVLALDKKFGNKPRDRYMQWFQGMKNLSEMLLKDPLLEHHLCILGNIQTVHIGNDIIIVNMIAQHGVRSGYNTIPLSYPALEECLNKAFQYARDYAKSILRPMPIHMPRIGCGLAGGEWDRVEGIIKATMLEEQEVTVWDLPK